MDFRWKVQYVASAGHNADPPKIITYSSVIVKMLVRVALVLDALNDMDVHLTDIGNAYLII